jgi:hypothetical protein
MGIDYYTTVDKSNRLTRSAYELADFGRQETYSELEDDAYSEKLAYGLVLLLTDNA